MNKRIILTIIAFTFLFGAFGQYNLTIDSLENILKTAKADTVKVDYMNAISFQYRNINDFKTAKQYADSALELAQTLDYKEGIYESHRKMVLVYAQIGFPPESLGKYFAHLKIFDERGLKKGITSCYHNIGIVYGYMGNYPEALEYHLIALKIAKEIRNKHFIASCYGSIGSVYKNLGSHQEALEYYLSSLKMWEEVGDYWFISDAYNSIGMVYATMGNPSEALENYFTSLKIIKNENNAGPANSYNNIGLIYQNQGNYAEALKKYLAALKIYEKIGKKNGAASSYNYIGTIYQKQGNYHEARKYLDAGLALSKEIRSKPRIKDNYKALSILESTEGNFAQALEHHKMYTLYKDSLFNEQSNNQVALLRIRYETEKKDREIKLLNKDKTLQEQKLEKQRLVRNASIIGAMLLLLLSLLFFRSFRLRKKLEKQKAIIQERKRISTDLHDDIGSGLSRIMLLSELVKKEAKTPKSRKEVEKIATISHELSSNINEIVWALNSNNDYVDNLVAYIRRYASEYFENSSVRLIVNNQVNVGDTHISGEHRRNIFFAVKEALHNIIKHAMATETRLKFTLKHNVLSIIINDNGKGFNNEELNMFGNGLNNMRNRMKNINGNCIIENHKGARITLTLPM